MNHLQCVLVLSTVPVLISKGDVVDKCPSPDGPEAQALFSDEAYKLKIDPVLKSFVDEQIQKDNPQSIPLELFSDLSQKKDLNNIKTDPESKTFLMCGSAYEGEPHATGLLYGSDARCGKSFCHQFKSVLDSHKLCPQDSPNFDVLEKYTRCLKVAHMLEIKREDDSKETIKVYKDACNCSICDKISNDLINYIVYEDGIQQGAYSYLRLDLNPYKLGEDALNKNYKVDFGSQKLKYFALINPEKYKFLFDPAPFEPETSNCRAGIVKVASKSKN